VSFGLRAHIRVAKHDPGDGLPVLPTRSSVNGTHAVGKSFGEALGPGVGSSVQTVTQLISGNDDLCHMIFALPLLDRVVWKEAVQEEKTVGVGFVRCDDELVGVHFSSFWKTVGS
jgi:hypothetical protein